MSILIGREKELSSLKNHYLSDKSEFLAIFGRRRVGKTYLIRSAFHGNFLLQLTGSSGASLSEQLFLYSKAVQEQHPNSKYNLPESWIEAFQILKSIILKSRQTKKVIFIDELPWFDTPNSKFISALEHFWNSWASSRNDIMLIVCGSAASWMINQLINNKGGLHNRITLKMKIEPFTLAECAKYNEYRKLGYNHYQLIQLYMILGGIPYYWDALIKGIGVNQNIDHICFAKNGLLRSEFSNLLKSLFDSSERHQEIIIQLAKKNKGLSREEIITGAKMSNGGSVTRLLQELEECGFIKKYIPFGKKSRNSLYQLSDFYSLFYNKFIEPQVTVTNNYWTTMIDSPKYRAWSGYAFEQVCLAHLNKIHSALGIEGVQTQCSTWRSSNSSPGAQIDLIIDRRDQIIHLCEMKFSINPYCIDKKYDANLRNKIGVFKEETKTKKAIFLTMITTFGLQNNQYSSNVQNDLTMKSLF